MAGKAVIMIVRLAGRQIEDVLLDRLDELLDKEEVGLSDDESIELDIIGEWQDVYMDYVETLNKVLHWYEENGVHFA